MDTLISKSFEEFRQQIADLSRELEAVRQLAEKAYELAQYHNDAGREK